MKEKKHLNTQIYLKASLHQTPKSWTDTEVAYLLKYYPLYKMGSIKWNAQVIRGHLKSRTLRAISTKYWTLMGSEHKVIREDIKQMKFPFAQTLVTSK